MDKVMDLKQMFLEAKGMYSPLCSLLSRAHRVHLPEKSLEHMWFSPTQILHGSQWSQHDVGLMNFPPLTEENPSWPIR